MNKLELACIDHGLKYEFMKYESILQLTKQGQTSPRKVGDFLALISKGRILIPLEEL